MSRPIFLTRTQRAVPRLKRAALALLVLSCFAFCGAIIGAAV